jgi:hypothetical protein
VVVLDGLKEHPKDLSVPFEWAVVSNEPLKLVEGKLEISVEKSCIEKSGAGCWTAACEVKISTNGLNSKGKIVICHLEESSLFREDTGDAQLFMLEKVLEEVCLRILPWTANPRKKTVTVKEKIKGE